MLKISIQYAFMYLLAYENKNVQNHCMIINILFQLAKKEIYRKVKLRLSGKHIRVRKTHALGAILIVSLSQRVKCGLLR